jgi:hypothetical protein
MPYSTTIKALERELTFVFSSSFLEPFDKVCFLYIDSSSEESYVWCPFELVPFDALNVAS